MGAFPPWSMADHRGATEIRNNNWSWHYVMRSVHPVLLTGGTNQRPRAER